MGIADVVKYRWPLAEKAMGEYPGFTLVQVPGHNGPVDLNFVVYCGEASHRFTIGLRELMEYRVGSYKQAWVNEARAACERIWSRWMAL